MKLLIFSLVAASSMIIACNSEKKNDSPGKKDSMPSAVEKNRQTALASIMAINAHDPGTVVKDAAMDCMDLGDGSMAPVKGADSIKAGLTAWLAAFPDVKGEDLETLSNADGSKVAVTGTWGGTFKNDFMGMKATGKSYKVKDADIFTFNEEGKITSHASLQSNMTIMSQVGAMMPK